MLVFGWDLGCFLVCCGFAVGGVALCVYTFDCLRGLLLTALVGWKFG